MTLPNQGKDPGDEGRVRLRAALDDALRSRKDCRVRAARRWARSATRRPSARRRGCPVPAARTLPVPLPVSMPQRRSGVR